MTFEGTVRDVEFLDYEAYREMAEEQMRQIIERAIERGPGAISVDTGGARRSARLIANLIRDPASATTRAG